VNRLHADSYSNNPPSLEQKRFVSPNLSHEGNPAYCCSPHLTLQLTCCLRQLNATAIPPTCPCNNEIPSFSPPCGIDNGRAWRRYIFTYYHDGSHWDFIIPAWSIEDAQNRINKISLAQYVGELHHIIKARTGMGLFMRFFYAIKNIITHITEK